MRNWRLDTPGIARSGETLLLPGTGPGLDHQEAAGWIIRWICNRTKLIFRSEPSTLAGYPVQLPTLHICSSSLFGRVECIVQTNLKV